MMSNVPLQSLDLNLLLVFEALLQEQNVTRAAEKIGRSQSATSSALARLRQLMHDPLFERRDGSMVPTARARQLGESVELALSQLRSALEGHAAFDASSATHEFRIATNDYVEATLLLPLVRDLVHESRGISIRTLRSDFLFEPPVDALRSGEVQLAVGPYPQTNVSRHLFTRTLVEDRLVCIARRRHPIIRRRLDLKAFLATPHARVVYPRDVHGGIVDSLLRARDAGRRVVVTVPHMTLIPRIVETTDCLGIIPLSLARLDAESRKFHIYDPPVPLPDVTLTMLWHERTHLDPAHVWLREKLAEHARRG